MNNSFVTYGCKTSTVHLRCIIINYTNCYNSTMSSIMDLVLKNKVDDSGSPGTPNRLPELFDSHELLSEVWWTMIDICGPYDSGGSTTDEWTSTVGRGRRVRTSWQQSTEPTESAWRTSGMVDPSLPGHEERQKVLRDGEATYDNCGSGRFPLSVRFKAQVATHGS
jgi:hypothetical protein